MEKQEHTTLPPMSKPEESALEYLATVVSDTSADPDERRACAKIVLAHANARSRAVKPPPAPKKEPEPEPKKKPEPEPEPPKKTASERFRDRAVEK